MPSFTKPPETAVRAFLAHERALPYSYPAVGNTREDTPVAGYDNDFNFIELGKGEAVWEAAKEGIRRWKMFPEHNS